MFHIRNCYLFSIYFSAVYFSAISFSSVYRLISLESACDNYCLKRWHDRPDAITDFEGFDNEMGTPDGRYIVPNYVHFIRFKYDKMSFIHAACIFAAFKYQKPDKLYIHYDSKPRGRYWDILMRFPGFKEVLVLNRIRMPAEIFDHELTWINKKWHAGDFARLTLLMKYGGIFLDNDSLFIRSVDDFRKYEVSVNWLDKWVMMNQAVIAHKNARYIRLWYESYRVYNETNWYWNAGSKPTRQILLYHPYLVHRDRYLLVSDQKFNEIYLYNWTEWKSHYVIHLNYRWTDELPRNLSDVARYPVEFNETNIALYNATIRDIIYHVFPPGFIEQQNAADRTDHFQILHVIALALALIFIK